MVSQQFTIIDPQGLHARPTSKLVGTASKFTSNINLKAKGKEVNLKSIMGVMALGIGLGDELIITAEGDDEQAALDALKDTLINEGLAE